MLVLKYCSVEETHYGCITRFEDNSTSANWAPEGQDFIKVANDCGFADLRAYIFDHDLSHAFLAEKLFDATSPVLWEAAHGGCLAGVASLYEERLVYHWQRYISLLIPPLEPEWQLWAYEYKSLIGDNIGKRIS